MRRWAVVMVLLLAALVIPARGASPQEVAGEQAGALDLEELEEMGEEYGAQIDWSEGADWEGGLQDLVDQGKEEAGGILRSAVSSAVVLLVIVVLCGVAGAMRPAVPKGVDPVTLAGTLAITALAVGNVNALMGLGLEAIGAMETFSDLLLPAVAAITAASGSITGAAVRQMAAILFSQLLLHLINDLLIPLTCVYLAAGAAGAALNSQGLRRLAGTLKWAITSMLTTVLLVFVTYLTISGVVAGTGDAVAVKATKFAVSSAVPVVGGILSDAAETVLAGASILKNTVGVFGMLVILGICLVPFLQLGIHYLVYKITAALAATVADGPLAGLIECMGTGFGLILGMTGACALLLLISLVSSVSVSVL